MNKLVNFSRPFAALAFLVTIFGFIFVIVRSGWFQINTPEMNFAITFDLLFTAPLIYLLIIRKTKIPKLTMAPVFFAGLVFATFLIPAQNQYFLDLAKMWVLPLVELTIASVLIFKTRKAIILYRQNKSDAIDFYTGLKSACMEILPKRAAAFFATEIAMFYYAFFTWKKQVPSIHEFTYHKNSGTIALLVAVLLIVAVETTAVHLLVAPLNNTLAWILSILSIYSAVIIFGIIKSMSRRLIVLANESLHLKYGILSEMMVPYSEISSVERSTKDFEAGNSLRKLTPLGDLEGHNVIIHLKSERIIEGFYGTKRTCKSVALFVDDAAAFVEKLQARMIS